MNLLLITAVTLGLASNFHCMGMCGPIAFALPVNNENTRTKLTGILAYNFGRILTYVIIGALFGLFGQGLKLAGISQWVSIAIGISFILYVIAPQIIKKTGITNQWYLKFNNFIKQKLGDRLKKKSVASLTILGLLNGLLPCGMVYVAVFAALGFSEGVVGGMIFMAMFGIGTLPAMVGMPLAAQSLSSSFRLKFQKAVPIIMLVFGAVFVLRGMNLNIPYLSPAISDSKVECCSKPK